jgi:hypothetical protein
MDNNFLKKTTSVLTKSIFKFKRLIELTISFLVFFVYLYILRMRLFSFYYNLFISEENEVYIDGEYVKLNKLELFKFLINLNDTLYLLLIIVIIYGIYQVIRKNKTGIRIVNLLLLLIIIPTFFINISGIENSLFPFLVTLPGLIIAAMFFYINTILIKMYDIEISKS